MSKIIHVDFTNKKRIEEGSLDYTTDRFTCDVCDLFYEYDSREGLPKTMRIKAFLPSIGKNVVMCQHCIKNMHDMLFDS